MDSFKSIIFHNADTRTTDGHLLFDFSPGGVTSLEGADIDTNEIYIDADALGWNYGGLAKTMVARGCGTVFALPMFFRGHAMFDNIDDAKNDYLMEPFTDCVVDGEICYQVHVPFGMVIPVWDNRVSPRLLSATVVLFWQEPV